MTKKRSSASSAVARFSNLGVQTKIVSAVAVAVVVAATVGLLGLSALSRTAKSGQALYAQNMASIRADARINLAVKAYRIAELKPDISPSDVAQHTQAGALATAQQEFTAAMAAYLATHPVSPSALTNQVSAEFAQYTEIVQTKALPASRAHNAVLFDKLDDELLSPVADRLSADLSKMEALENAAAKRSAANLRSTYASSRLSQISILVAGLLAALALGIAVARLIVRNLAKVRASAEALAEGDLTRQSNLTGSDEVAAMGRAMDTAISNLRSLVGDIDSSASSLSSAAEELAVTSATIAESAQHTSEQADRVAAAAAQVSMNVQTVATGSEEMSTSISEIAVSTSEAARAGSTAVTVAASTNATVATLGSSSEAIAAVVKVITGIAEQTNLLALNATIEAARAGDAGKGFAVVASEVKDLAKSTALATDDIFNRVQAIQADTSAAVDAIGEISKVIGQINDFQVTISTAVEEQTATTSEMNRNVAQAATGSADIAAIIDGVASGAQLTTAGVAQSQGAVSELARMSTDLRSLVSRFTI